MRSLFTDIKNLLVHKDVFLNVFVLIIWGNMLLGYMRGIVNHIPVLDDYTDAVIVLTIVIPLILALPALLSRFRVFDYFFFLMMVTAYLMNYAIHPENQEYLNENIFKCLCVATPLYFVGRILDIEKYFRAMTLVSVMCILMSLFYFLHYAQSAKNMAEVAGDDNMYTAYQVLPHIVLLLWNSLRKFNILHMAATAMGILFLLSCGTRGPLACLAFFGMCYFLFFMNFRYALLIKSAIIGAMGVVFMFLQEIVSYLAFTFTGLKLSTRILDKLVSGEIGNDSGRTTLKVALVHFLDTYGNICGLGYFGSQRFGYIYAHDLILDFQISYGYILGSIILVMLFALCGWAVIRCKTKMQRCFIIALISITLVKFFLSSTFLYDLYFYILLGYCCRIVFEQEQKQQDGIQQA